MIFFLFQLTSQLYISEIAHPLYGEVCIQLRIFEIFTTIMKLLKCNPLLSAPIPIRSFHVLFSSVLGLRWPKEDTRRSKLRSERRKVGTHYVQIHLLVSLYCKVKLLPTQIWMWHSFYQNLNFLTNSLVLSNPVLFAFRDYNITNS